MGVFRINSSRGGIADFEDKGLPGSFKFASNIDIRKEVDSITCQQALIDEGVTDQSASASRSPSASLSPSASPSPSPSASPSPSSSPSSSTGVSSASVSPSASRSPSASASPSLSRSPSSSVSPSVSPSSALDSVFRDLVRVFVKGSDGNTYGFGSTGYVYKRNQYGYWSVVYKFRSAVKGAYEWGSNSGKSYLYVALDTELHRKELPGLSNWNDVDGASDSGWPKTNLSPADWHTMRECGGSLIIANGNFLALVGYDESYTNEALDLIPGNIAKTIIERKGRTIIGTYRQWGEEDKGVNAAIDTEVPLAQIGDDGALFFANMIDGVPIKRFPGGGKVNPGGVTNQVDQANFFEWEQTALSWIDKQSVGNMSLWGVYAGESGKSGVYSYGRKNKNHSFTLNLDYKVTADEIGAITETEGILLVSYKLGSDFGVKALDPTTKAVGTYQELDLKAPDKKPADITNWKVAELYMAPLPAGASVELWYKMNKTGSFVQAKTADGQTRYSVTGGKKAVFAIGAEGEIFEAQIVLNPIGNLSPEVYRRRYYFD